MVQIGKRVWSNKPIELDINEDDEEQGSDDSEED